MKHTSCLLSPARAFHRALLLELANTSKSNAVSSSTAFSSSFPRPLPTLRHTRTPCRVRALSTTSPAQRMMIKKHLRDKAIPYQWVRVADETGALSPPQRTESVLTSLPRGHSLVMVAPPPPPPPPSASDTPLQPSAAICRIVDAAAEKAAADAAAKESKKLAQHTKTLEINWAIAPNDLAHKMKRLDEFLGKGMRVEILFARKRGSRVATREEWQALVERVKEAAANVPGANEYKRMDGHVGAVMRMFFEGPANKKKVKKDKGDGKGIDGEE
ncbi:hypothetical protein HD806DRAFT_498695 [Xylariaceae sp. AK1471]|nr:hypothetical protein HD806DRAFT_498695 [Xylariaceae sp. AK1471]